MTDDERMQLEADRRTADAFRMRRAQIVLASARGLSPQPIAQPVGCCVQTVRNVLHAFNTPGLACVSQTIDAAQERCTDTHRYQV